MLAVNSKADSANPADLKIRGKSNYIYFFFMFNKIYN